MLFPSCENDIETINALTSELDIPDQTGYDVEIAYYDSGRLQGRIITPEVNRYDRVDHPYIEFPKGMEVQFYNDSDRAESFIHAKYAIYYQDTHIWEARNEVVAENRTTHEKLETEQLFWDEDKKIIYSEKYSVITNSDGVFVGQAGFDANQDLTNWTLRRSRGTANVKEESPPDEP
jgi:LPS export ABC transporter protein LptC